MTATPPSRGVRVAVFAAIVAALAAGAWLALRPADREPAPASAPASTEAAAARAQRAAGLATREKDPDVAPGAPVEEPAAPEPPEEEAIPLAPKDGPVRLKVTLVGEGPTPKVVELTATLDENYAHRVRLILAPPALEGRLPAAARFDLEFVIDGWRSDQWSGELAPSEDGSLAIEVHLPARPTLAVVDATSGAPLAEAEALRMGWNAKENESALGPTLYDRDEGGSPVQADTEGRGRIELPITANAEWFWVRAPAHAWARVRVPAASEEIRVPLAPGGGIRAEIEGVKDWAGLHVVATHPVPAKPADPSILRLPGSEGKRDYEETRWDVAMNAGGVPDRFEFEGLPPGAWRVVVGRGRYGADELLGEAAVEIVSGRTAEVRVMVRARLSAPKCQVDLEISVPEGWRGGDLSVNVSGVSEKNEQEDHDLPQAAAGTAVVRARLALPRGPYEVIVRPLDWVALVRVRADGETLRIAIPPPVRVRVRVLDAEGRAVVMGTRVHASYLSPYAESLEAASPPVDDDPAERPDRWSSGTVEIEKAREGSDFVGEIAAGSVGITAEAIGRLETSVTLVLTPTDAEREIEIRLPRAGSIEIRIVKDGKLVTDADGDLTLEPAKSGDEPVDWSQRRSFSGGRGRFDGLAAGTYVVGWSPLGKSAGVEKTVTVRIGEVTTVELEAK